MVARIYIVDDDPALCGSIAALLSAHGYAGESYFSATEFLAHADLAGTGVLITDLAMPAVTGLQLQAVLCERDSVLAVVMVTGAADVSAAVRVMQHGAITLLEKPFSATELIAAVKLGLERSLALHEAKTQRAAVLQHLAGLSQDELAVLEAMIAGQAIKSCASNLHLSTRTVERYRRAILERIGASSIPELAVIVERARRGADSRPPLPAD